MSKGFGCEKKRLRLSFLGEGETGSPRRRFRARTIAVLGPGTKDGIEEGEETGFTRDLVGVANGFGEACLDDLPLSLTGEKGLNPASGGVTWTAARDLEGNNERG